MFVHPIVSNFERRNINNYIKTRGINRHCPGLGHMIIPMNQVYLWITSKMVKHWQQLEKYHGPSINVYELN